jgi:hypothetical protein
MMLASASLLRGLFSTLKMEATCSSETLTFNGLDGVMSQKHRTFINWHCDSSNPRVNICISFSARVVMYLSLVFCHLEQSLRTLHEHRLYNCIICMYQLSSVIWDITVSTTARTIISASPTASLVLMMTDKVETWNCTAIYTVFF